MLPSKCKRQHRILKSRSMRTSRGTKIMNSFPWLQSHLVGWEGWLSSSSAKSLEPKLHQGTLYVGHILRRLIDISQIAVQKGNFRRLQKAVAICSTDDPFSNLRVSRDHLRSMSAQEEHDGAHRERRGPVWRPGPTRSQAISAPRDAQQQLGPDTPVEEPPRTRKPRPATRAR
jgi:hypothetical protein